jgi:hypothetical protein
MIDAAVKKEYWAIVRDCLVRFHAWRPIDATRKCAEVRGQNEQPDEGELGEIIYHDEPFNVACDIQGERLTLDETTRAKYRQILADHQWIPNGR